MGRLSIFVDGVAYPTKDQKIDEDVKEVTLSLTRSLAYNADYRILILGGEDQGLKRTLEGLIEALVTVGQTMSLSKREYESPMTQNDLHVGFAYTMRALSSFLGYMLNSTSWQQQEIKDFDRDEFAKRLQYIQSIILNPNNR